MSGRSCRISALRARSRSFRVYDLAAAGKTLTRESLATREKSLWRYREVLPLPLDVEPVTFGEGGTPLLRAARFGAQAGVPQLLVKDEAQNPTQSFKARGMATAVSMAKQLGATKLAAPSAGNAGGALAAYAARAGLEAHIFMPRDTPRANIIECRELGAHVTLIDGLITDCGAEVAKRKAAEGWFDMSTLKEPYRVEGKKTLGYELAEQLNWELARRRALPDRRRHRSDRDVESVRRNGDARLDRLEAAAHVFAFKRAAARRSCARLKLDREIAPEFPNAHTSPPACACRKRSATSSCCASCANPAAARSRSTTRR